MTHRHHFVVSIVVARKLSSGPMTGISNVRVAVSELLSFTCTVKLEVPAAVGVPLSCPAVLRANPAGNVPLVTDHWYGDVPPLAVSVCVYAVPTVPLGTGEVVVIASPAPIVNLKFCVAVSELLSFACTVILEVPAAVGVPLSCPAVLRANPAGNVPLVTDH